MNQEGYDRGANSCRNLFATGLEPKKKDVLMIKQLMDISPPMPIRTERVERKWAMIVLT